MRNSKHESRNKDRIGRGKFDNEASVVIIYFFGDLEFVSDFALRNSDFQSHSASNIASIFFPKSRAILNASDRLGS